MTDSNPSGQEGTDKDRRLEILRSIPGFHLDEGEPCLCGAEFLKTRGRTGYSDFAYYSHTCGRCGNQFSTYIEG